MGRETGREKEMGREEGGRGRREEGSPEAKAGETTGPASVPAPEQQQQEQQEQQQQQQQHNDELINKVASDVTLIQEGLQAISKEVTQLAAPQGSFSGAEHDLVTKLHQRCAHFSESLMKDLYTLDELSLKEEDRHKRKEQVQRIQAMTSDVDSLLNKLHDLAQVMRSQREALQEKQRQAQEAEKRQLDEQQQRRRRQEQGPAEEEGEEGGEEEEGMEEEEEEEDEAAVSLQPRRQKMKPQQQTRFVPLSVQHRSEADEVTDQSIRLEAIWRRLKLNPKFSVDEAVDGYLLSGYVPGMAEEDVFLSLRDGVLSLRGHRSPTHEELALLRRQLRKAGVEPSDEAVVRLGMGRFGTFLQRFALPDDVDQGRMAASYEGGEVRIVLPRRRRPIQPQPQPRARRAGWSPHFVPPQDPLSAFDQHFWW